MITAFWNINTGTTSFPHRRALLRQWSQALQPDLVFLEEVSHKLLIGKPPPILNCFPGYDLHSNFEYTLDKNDNPTTKCLAVLIRQGQVNQVHGVVSARLVGANQRRRALRANVTVNNNSFGIWGLHANASPKGGRDAVTYAVKRLQETTGHFCVFGGDFNCRHDAAVTLMKPEQSLVAPQGYPDPQIGGVHGPMLPCTQWKTTPGGSTDVNLFPAMRLTRQLDLGLEPHYMIDYVIHNQGVRQVTPLANCLNGDMWTDIVAQFDHAPVVYDIQ